MPLPLAYLGFFRKQYPQRGIFVRFWAIGGQVKSHTPGPEPR